jgi:hypothetical protein
MGDASNAGGMQELANMANKKPTREMLRYTCFHN